jgi:hypothetical protein
MLNGDILLCPSLTEERTPLYKCGRQQHSYKTITSSFQINLKKQAILS